MALGWRLGVDGAIPLATQHDQPATANPLAARFGTGRGLLRLLLSYGQVTLLGRAVPDPASVKRLVFVCQGNICRSAYAEATARARGLGAASFGLSTESGKLAHPPAIATAAVLGHDLSGHRTTRREDFKPQPGDLYLVMEVRQLARLAVDPQLAAAPRDLLGLWTRPKVPHLHDPYGLDPAYMLTCLNRIEAAVDALARAFPGAAASPYPPSDRR